MQVADIEDFDEILEQAEANADSDWEIEFTTDMRSRYNQYGDRCFVSEKQIEHLERIANWA